MGPSQAQKSFGLLALVSSLGQSPWAAFNYHDNHGARHLAIKPLIQRPCEEKGFSGEGKGLGRQHP